VDGTQRNAQLSQDLGTTDEVQRGGSGFPDAYDETTQILQPRARMDLLLRKTGDDQPEGLHAGLHKGFEGDYPWHRMLPSVLFVMRRLKVMVVRGERKLMLKVMWDALKKLIDGFFRRL